MQNINERLSGVCPILPTPFCEDDTIDCGSLEREVNFLLDSGVSGIALFGNASEAFALTAAEKQQIAELVVRVNNGLVPLVFGAGGTGIEPAIDSAQWAYKNGADVLMMMPPYMIKPDAQRIYDYYAAVAKAVPLPIMIQDAPGACGVNIPIDTIVRLVNDYDNIRFVKAEAPPTFQKAKKIIEATGGKVTVFGGLNATFFYEELCSGVVGTMPAGEFPDVLVRVYELYTSGRHEQAREEFYRYLPFIRLGSVPGGMAMAVHKEVLVKGGIFRTAKVRNPYVPASPELLELVWQALETRPLKALEYAKA